MDFLGSLSSEMLQAYEHAILLGWPEVREKFGFLAGDASIESIEPVTPITRSEAGSAAADPAWVWPTEDATAVRVRLTITWEDEVLNEDLLFVRERLPELEGTEGSRLIRIGEQWYLRDRHPNGSRYQTPRQGPTMGWKLLAPYLPYQGTSRLAQILRERSKE